MGGSLPPPPLSIEPPLLNSANPWATSLEDLKRLFDCPSTGAVTTRTALLDGFSHDPSIHQYTFFDVSTHVATESISASPATDKGAEASLNTLGYSPIPLDEYLGYIRTISDELSSTGGGDEDDLTSSEQQKEKRRRSKLFIISVTGTPDQVATCYRRIADHKEHVVFPLAMEVNLSCPNGTYENLTCRIPKSLFLDPSPAFFQLFDSKANISTIPGAPPPAYSGESLALYLSSIRDAAVEGEEGGRGGSRGRIPWGLKTPPYTHAGQFETLVAALCECGVDENPGGEYCAVSFLTATNTLGSCLVLGDDRQQPGTPKLAGVGIGGMAGAPLHPLALGNVATLRKMLDARESTKNVQIIGVGGVDDAAGYRRMRAVGAMAVGVGTALGRKGVCVFGEIEEALGENR